MCGHGDSLVEGCQIDPRHFSGMPLLKTLFEPFKEFDAASEEVQKRRETTEALRVIQERPIATQLQDYMGKKPPRIHDIQLNKCGKMIVMGFLTLWKQQIIQ